MNKKIIKNRVKKVRRLIKNKADMFVIIDPANVRYLTGFRGEDSWAAVTGRMVYLITDSRYIEQAQKECIGCRIVNREGNLNEEVSKIFKKSKSLKKLAIEDVISVRTLKELQKKAGKKPKALKDVIESLREIKDKNEITAVRKAGQIAGKALRKVQKYFQKGISESELAGLLDLEIKKQSSFNSFATIVAFGANGSRPHHKPGEKKLRKNDCILIDFGAVYDGYCSDITRCFLVGRAFRNFKTVYNVVLEAQNAAINKVQDGVAVQTVEDAAREIIKNADFTPYGHGTGHGLGLNVHEQPIVSSRVKGKLKAGNIITIEPGVYIPGKVGVRIEDDLLVTKNGCEILTEDIKK